MVAQHAQPHLSIKACTLIDVLEDVCPLARVVLDHVGWHAALHVHAAPVKVVAHVEDVIRKTLRGSQAHLFCHPLLGPVVDAHDEVAVAVELRGPVVGRPWGVAHAAPIADDEDVVLATCVKAGVLNRHAVAARRMKPRGRWAENLVANAGNRLPCLPMHRQRLP